ncbi:MAG: class I SAM-dependent methyltransferase, partial [Rhodospirillales bacterium]|nr:class I SAM-dependent methyltransferase [Rhodospirillales bacterium]
MAEYDAIAREYRASKRLPFREYVERYTLFELLGDLRGKTVLDLACGDGFYTRVLRQCGALEVTGVDISEGMIDLAEAQERRHPLGCRYVCADVAEFEAREQVDLVVAVYLLNYAGTPDQLQRFCLAAHGALRAGGRFVGLNNNVNNVAVRGGSLREYGLERTWERPLAEGDVIRYTMFNADGAQFGFDNFYLRPQTHEVAFERAGFRDFRWIDVA